MQDFITIVGLDAHKESIEIVTADEFGEREVRHVGKVGGDMMSLDKAVRKLRSRGSELRFVYEAGPCGYEIYRHLSAQGYHCAVVAPSMIPRKSGNRIKNDRRDAEALARLYRAGELTAVYVPCEEDEAMRDLTRGRQDAVKVCAQPGNSSERFYCVTVFAILARHLGRPLICAGYQTSRCLIPHSRSPCRNTAMPSGRGATA